MSNRLLSVLLAAGLLLYPFATYAADYGSQATQNQQVPPVAQPLVREGDFAIKLASQLNLGSPTDEATAEDMLTKAGVVPANGWISDYPVTPEIIGQLNESISRSADAGKLPLGSEDAKKELFKVAQQMDLPLPAGPGNEPAAGQPSLSSSDNTTINNYYYQQGPPVVTYYPPPAGYAYLYDWVPYPVVWFGFSFPGFFICHNFTTVVVRPFPHHFGHAIVTDHFIDPRTRTVVHVDHAFITDRGMIRPHTMLKTADGRTFGHVNEFRHAEQFRGHLSAAPGFTRPAGRGMMTNRTFAQNVPGPASQIPQRSFRGAMNTGHPTTPLRIQQAPSLGPMNTGRSSLGAAASGRRFSGPAWSGPTRSFPGGAWHGSGAGGFARGGGGHVGGRR